MPIVLAPWIGLIGTWSTQRPYAGLENGFNPKAEALRMLTLSLLVTAILFGGMVLYSFGFAAFLFTALPANIAGPTIRRAFPLFYLFVLGCSAAEAFLVLSSDVVAAALLALIAVTTVPTSKLLMPAINRATDTKATSRFNGCMGYRLP